jgi:hypothetical protein
VKGRKPIKKEREEAEKHERQRWDLGDERRGKK